MSTKSSNASPRISHKETENRGQKLLKSILHKYYSSLSMVINVPELPWILAEQKQFLINSWSHAETLQARREIQENVI